MNANIQRSEEAKINALAEQYAREGFTVTREPSPNNLPFDLGGYCPDLVAVKGNTGIILEVKEKSARLPVERFRALAEEVAGHPGWRFLLVTLDEENSSSLPGISETYPSWTELGARVAQVRRLLQEDENGPALLYLWSVFEAALRKRAIEIFIPIERFPVMRLLEHMYSLGELSVSQYDLVMTLFEIRNKLAHGFLLAVESGIVGRFAALIEELLADWSPQDDSRQVLTAGKFSTQV